MPIEPAAMESASLRDFRTEVRAFWRQALADFEPAKLAESWMLGSKPLTREVGQQGLIGLTWPKDFGGRELTNAHRYIVWEEALAQGAPINYCMPMDRQTGPMLLRHASARLQASLLPRMVAGDISFCVGMSEPDSGSDLASIRSRAERTHQGWLLNGRKVWTSGAHDADYMVGLFRSEKGSERHKGLSQFVIDMKSPGITVRGIRNLRGLSHFNECVFDNVAVPADALLGAEGEGWKQVSEELAFERSGPERFLSSFVLLREMVDNATADDEAHTERLGHLIAELLSVREMSLGISAMLDAGHSPANAAALVKDLGTTFEQKLPDAAFDMFDVPADDVSTLAVVLRQTALCAPEYSIRGGAREILRGVIAKGLGL
ncbi:acyl-CoA dehydrogenase family protein [Variovorax sp. KK3]|uniref:acyl-CoA dehydrogenase family protein n=1 Tax=Variovorax sp. KK3 TaxID=1855728 RepID=UPI00117FB8FD|nr:acyl-CoA dehydrogenase family protein [Variovorax sp. KK3]